MTSSGLPSSPPRPRAILASRRQPAEAGPSEPRTPAHYSTRPQTSAPGGARIPEFAAMPRRLSCAVPPASIPLPPLTRLSDSNSRCPAPCLGFHQSRLLAAGSPCGWFGKIPPSRARLRSCKKVSPGGGRMRARWLPSCGHPGARPGLNSGAGGLDGGGCRRSR